MVPGVWLLFFSIPLPIIEKAKKKIIIKINKNERKDCINKLFIQNKGVFWFNVQKRNRNSFEITKEQSWTAHSIWSPKLSHLTYSQGFLTYDLCFDLFHAVVVLGEEPGSHLKRFTPGHVFSRIGISSSLAGPRLTKLVLQTCTEATKDNPSGVETVETNDAEGTSEPQVANTIGALMAGAAAKRREREDLFTKVGPCRRALCARKDLAMRKRLRRLTGKVCSGYTLQN